MRVIEKLNFKNFLEEVNLTSMLSPDVSSDDAYNRQSTDRFHIASIRNFILPTKTVTSEIRLFNDKNNPILIQLLDGTKISLSHDELRRIQSMGQAPEVGKRMTVVFQRNMNDKSDNYSIINSITVH